MWDMLIRQIEFNTSENQRMREKMLVQDTQKGMWRAVFGVLVPILTSILTAYLMGKLAL